MINYHRSKTMKLYGKYLFFLITCFVISSCAFGARHVTLDPIKTSLSLDASGQIVLIEVKDKRNPELKPVVGHVKNGYGMKTAKVIANKEVSIWVKNSIVGELKRYGASVIESESEESDGISKVSIDVLVCYAQAYMRYGGEITVVLGL